MRVRNTLISIPVKQQRIQCVTTNYVGPSSSLQVNTPHKSRKYIHKSIAKQNKSHATVCCNINQAFVRTRTHLLGCVICYVLHTRCILQRCGGFITVIISRRDVHKHQSFGVPAKSILQTIGQIGLKRTKNSRGGAGRIQFFGEVSNPWDASRQPYNDGRKT